MPARPWSRLWFDAVEQPSYPVSFTASISSTGAPNDGYPDSWSWFAAAGTSRWHMARPAPSMIGRIGASIGVKSYRPPAWAP